jgi:hypothetical protein
MITRKEAASMSFCFLLFIRAFSDNKLEGNSSKIKLQKTTLLCTLGYTSTRKNRLITTLSIYKCGLYKTTIELYPDLIACLLHIKYAIKYDTSYKFMLYNRVSNPAINTEL